MKTHKFKFIFLIFLTPFFIKSINAHCPLCTIGAGAAAAGAIWLGVSKVVVAMFIGAFAMSMGMWFSKKPKKRYIPFQKTLIISIIFLTTVIPLMPMFEAIGPLYLSFIGNYGTTFAFDYSIISSLLGGVIVFVSPPLNEKIKQKRNGKGIPFQGMLITFTTLFIFGGIIQLIV